MSHTWRPNISKKKIQVLTLGYVPLDLIVTSVDPLSLERAAGGTCGNVSIILSRLGFATTMLAEFGDDPRGEYLRRDLAGEGVDIAGLTIRKDRPTGAIVEIIEPKRHRTHRFAFRCPICKANLRRSNLVTRAKTREYLTSTEQYSVLFLDRATAAVVEIVQNAVADNSFVFFEPNVIRSGSREELAAEQADIVKYAVPNSGTNRIEWNPSSTSRTRVVIETFGTEGLRYRRRLKNAQWSQWKQMQSIRAASVADTAGAGDWCTAGIIHDLMTGPVSCRWNGDKVDSAIIYGQSLAALSVSFTGPRGLTALTDFGDIKRIARRAANLGNVSPRSVQRLKARASLPKNGQNGAGCPLCLSDTEPLSTV